MCEVCPKVYHFECSGLDSKDADFVCPWHACTACQVDLRTTAAGGAGFYCVNCTASHCAPCAAASGLAVATVYASPAAVPSAEAFAALRRNGYTLAHPSDTLYVCGACQENTDAVVGDLLGLPMDEALNVKRDVPLAHRKLTHQPVGLAAPAAPAAATAMDVDGGSSDANGGGGGEEEAAAQAEAGRAAAAVPAVRDFLAGANGHQPVAMARRGWLLLPQVCTCSRPAPVYGMQAHPCACAPAASSPQVRCCQDRAPVPPSLPSSPDAHLRSPAHQLRHPYVGRRARRFLPNAGLSDGTIVGYLPARHNKGMATWHCVHDDGDRCAPWPDWKCPFYLCICSHPGTSILVRRRQVRAMPYRSPDLALTRPPPR